MPTLLRILFFVFLSLPVYASPIKVAASFSILGDLVQQIGGERVQINVLVGADQDAHVYMPSPQDVQKLTETQLFFVNGLGFEGWQSRLLKSSRYQGQIVTVTVNIKPLAMHGDEHDHGHGHSHIDPHVWQDPVQVKSMVNTISSALSKSDPAGAAYYQQRLQAYQKQLDTLITWAQTEIARIPKEKRMILTSHDAFAYLGHRFGIRIISPQGVSTESEASAQDVAKIIRQIKQSQIRALFMENISNPKMLEQISKETGALTGSKLYSDALSKSPEAADYLSMYRYNVSTLLAGMQRN